MAASPPRDPAATIPPDPRPPIGSTLARRRLRLALRAHRDHVGLTGPEVSRLMDWSLSKLTRVESGAVGLGPGDLTALIGVYQITDHAEVARLRDLARLSRQRHWAAQYRDIVSMSYMAMLGYEQDAQAVTEWHPQALPALVRTPAYARAYIDAVHLTALGHHTDTDMARRLSTERQQHRADLLTRGPAVFLMPEDALRRPALPTGQAIAQIDHLIDLCHRPGVTIGIVPSDADVPDRFRPAFVLHRFADDPPLAYQVATTDVLVLDDPPAVATYQEAATRLTVAATTGAAAARLLDGIRRDQQGHAA